MRQRLLASLALVLALASLVGTQGTITPSPFQVFLDNSGKIVNGGCVWTYTAGTTTPVATYTDQTLGTPNANPIIADSSGRFTAFLTPGSAYKFVYENIPCSASSHGAVLKTADQILASPSSSANLDLTVTFGQSVTAGEVVYQSAGTVDGAGKTGGQWYPADSTNAYSSITNPVGITLAAVAAGNTGTVRLSGYVTGLTVTPNSLYYVGIAGALTATAPAVNQHLLGRADTVSTLVLAGPPILQTLPVSLGGTSVTSLTANNVLMGNGTNPITTIAPSTSGNVLLSNGTTWTSSPLTASPMTLLKAGSGVNTPAVSASDLDTVAISGLTNQDTLVIYMTILSNTAANNGAFPRSVTDNVNLGTAVGYVFTNTYTQTYIIRQRNDANTKVMYRQTTSDTAGTSTGEVYNLVTLTTPWTGSWTLGLRTTGGSVGATLTWSWAVYKQAGQ